MVNVYASGNKVGELFESEITSSKFIFDYMNSPHPKDAISLTMPLSNEQYQFWHGLHPIFEMNLPEGMLLDKLKNLYRKQIPNFTDLGCFHHTIFKIIL